jgi:PrcB C-terminal
VVLVGIVVLVSKVGGGEGSTPVRWHDLSARVGPLRLTRSERRLFREQEQLDRYLRRVGGDRTPTVEFSRRQLLLISPGPRSSTGYSLEILRVSESGGKITVRVRERTPTLTDRVEPHVTYPYRLLSLPAGNDVYVDWIGR